MTLAIQTAIVMVVLLVVMLAMGVSISISVGLSSAVAMLCMLPAQVSFVTSAQRLFAGANSFSLIAIPFFILAGNLMNNGGIAERLVNVAKAIAGRMPGALAQTNVIVGTFMDPTPAVLIFTPIFLPICKTFGMHAVQFGIMVSMSLCIGTITPPVGSILFTGCKVGHVRIEQVIKELLPYFFAILAALLLVTYIPAISMTLPTLAGLIK